MLQPLASGNFVTHRVLRTLQDLRDKFTAVNRCEGKAWRRMYFQVILEIEVSVSE